MAKIQGWYGRTGNNIFQVGNALVHAYFNKSVFSCPNHELFHSFSAPFGYTPPSSGWYFHVDPEAYGGLATFTALRLKLIQEFLLPKLSLPAIDADLRKLIDDGAVVAHARGGDVFQNTPPSNYIQHPLDFYLHLQKIHKKVILLFEDKTNPVVTELSKDPDFHLYSHQASVDFSIFSQARSIALGGVGTFVPSACLLNKNLTNIYYSSVAPIAPYLPNSTQINQIYIGLPDYIPENMWTASEEQKNLMLKYKLPISNNHQ